DACERLGDAPVGADRGAGGLVASRADGGVDRLEEGGDLVLRSQIGERGGRLLAREAVLEELGDLRRSLLRAQVAQLLYRLDPLPRVRVGEARDPGVRIARIGRLARE